MAAAAEASGELVEVTLEDWDLLSGNDFMGRVGVPLAPLLRLQGARDGPRWYPIEAQLGETSEKEKAKPRGEVLWRVHTHDPCIRVMLIDRFVRSSGVKE